MSVGTKMKKRNSKSLRRRRKKVNAKDQNSLLRFDNKQDENVSPKLNVKDIMNEITISYTDPKVKDSSNEDDSAGQSLDDFDFSFYNHDEDLIDSASFTEDPSTFSTHDAKGMVAEKEGKVQERVDTSANANLSDEFEEGFELIEPQILQESLSPQTPRTTTSQKPQNAITGDMNRLVLTKGKTNLRSEAKCDLVIESEFSFYDLFHNPRKHAAARNCKESHPKTPPSRKPHRNTTPDLEQGQKSKVTLGTPDKLTVSDLIWEKQVRMTYGGMLQRLRRERIDISSCFSSLQQLVNSMCKQDNSKNHSERTSNFWLTWALNRNKLTQTFDYKQALPSTVSPETGDVPGSQGVTFYITIGHLYVHPNVQVEKKIRKMYELFRTKEEFERSYVEMQVKWTNTRTVINAHKEAVCEASSVGDDGRIQILKNHFRDILKAGTAFAADLLIFMNTFHRILSCWENLDGKTRSYLKFSIIDTEFSQDLQEQLSSLSTWIETNYGAIHNLPSFAVETAELLKTLEKILGRKCIEDADSAIGSREILLPRVLINYGENEQDTMDVNDRYLLELYANGELINEEYSISFDSIKGIISFEKVLVTTLRLRLKSMYLRISRRKESMKSEIFGEYDLVPYLDNCLEKGEFEGILSCSNKNSLNVLIAAAPNNYKSLPTAFAPDYLLECKFDKVPGKMLSETAVSLKNTLQKYRSNHLFVNSSIHEGRFKEESARAKLLRWRFRNPKEFYAIPLDEVSIWRHPELARKLLKYSDVDEKSIDSNYFSEKCGRKQQLYLNSIKQVLNSGILEVVVNHQNHLSKIVSEVPLSFQFFSLKGYSMRKMFTFGRKLRPTNKRLLMFPTPIGDLKKISICFHLLRVQNSLQNDIKLKIRLKILNKEILSSTRRAKDLIWNEVRKLDFDRDEIQRLISGNELCSVAILEEQSTIQNILLAETTVDVQSLLQNSPLEQDFILKPCCFVPSGCRPEISSIRIMIVADPPTIVNKQTLENLMKQQLKYATSDQDLFKTNIRNLEKSFHRANRALASSSQPAKVRLFDISGFDTDGTLHSLSSFLNIEQGITFCNYPKVEILTPMCKLSKVMRLVTLLEDDMNLIPEACNLEKPEFDYVKHILFPLSSCEGHSVVTEKNRAIVLYQVLNHFKSNYDVCEQWKIVLILGFPHSLCKSKYLIGVFNYRVEIQHDADDVDDMLLDPMSGEIFGLREKNLPMNEVHACFISKAVYFPTKTQRLNQLKFNFSDETIWRHMPTGHDKQVKISYKPLELSRWPPERIASLGAALNSELKKTICMERAKRALPTNFSQEMSRALRLLCGALENDRLGKLTAKIDDEYQRLTKHIIALYSVRCFFKNLKISQVKSIAQSIMSTGAIRSSSTTDVFATAAELFSYSQNTCSVWMCFAVLS